MQKKMRNEGNYAVIWGTKFQGLESSSAREEKRLISRDSFKDKKENTKR